jgi:hypothetical protein
MESATSHGWGWPRETRMYISSGVKGGIRARMRATAAVRGGEHAAEAMKQKDQRQDEKHIQLLQLLLGVGHGAEGGGDGGVEEIAEQEVDEEEDDLRAGEGGVDGLASEHDAGVVRRRGGRRSARWPTWVRPTEPTPMILPAIISSGTDGGEQDLKDARGLLLDDGAGDVHAVEHDDQVHEEEENGDADLAALAVVVMRRGRCAIWTGCRMASASAACNRRDGQAGSRRARAFSAARDGGAQ